MAGGAGTRFWPLSRDNKPKQFLDILNTGETLLQMSFRRLKEFCPVENILVVTHSNFYDLVKEQIPVIDDQNILCEPIRRNTAPCIAYATYKIKERNPEATIIVAPSDHIIIKENVFSQTCVDAMSAASRNDWIITIGITPNRPETGYGYIQFNTSSENSENPNLKKVKTFTEKPQKELATTFIESGDFLWNAGIFISSVKTLINAFNKHLSDVGSIFANGAQKYGSPMEKEFIANAYQMCPNISMDYGVMEKASNVYVTACDMGWSDLGTWGALHENSEKDAKNNFINSENNYIQDTENSIIYTPSSKLSVIQGLTDFIVVDENDVLLICPRSKEQQLRNVVEKLKKEGKESYL